MSVLLDNIPYKSAREGQLQILNYVNNTWWDDLKYKPYVIEAPTGAGKSGIVYALGKSSNTVYIVTSSKILQDQYYNEFKNYTDNIAVIKGQGNYLCNDVDDGVTTVIHAPCKDLKEGSKIKKDCIKMGICSYYSNIQSCKYKKFVIMNLHTFYYLVYVIKELMLPDVLLIDEAHKIENVFRDFFKIVILKKHFSKFKDKIKNMSLMDILNTSLNYYTYHLESLNKEYKVNKLPMIKKQISTYEISVKRLSLIIKNVEDYKEYDNYIIYTNDKGNLVLEPKSLMNKFNHMIKDINRVVFLSGFIGNVNSFLSNLGIKEAIYVKYGKHITPAINRKIHLDYTGFLIRRNKDTLFPRFLNKVYSIINKHKNSKGVIHVTSHEDCQNIYSFLTFKKNITCFKVDNLSGFLKYNLSSVLISPSSYEGLDLKLDLCRFQILFKVPFLMELDPFIKYKKKYDISWYNNVVVSRIVQSYGRGVRSSNDACDYYILDSMFESFYIKNQAYFPSYFKDAIVK